jgi:hypothetical protein
LRTFIKNFWEKKGSAKTGQREREGNLAEFYDEYEHYTICLDRSSEGTVNGVTPFQGEKRDFIYFNIF